MKKIFLLSGLFIFLLIVSIFIKVYLDQNRFRNELLKNSGINSICQGIKIGDKENDLMKKFQKFEYVSSKKDGLVVINFGKEWYGDIDLADSYSNYGGGNTKLYFKNEILIDKQCQFTNILNLKLNK